MWVPGGCGAAAEERLERQVSIQFEHLLYTHPLPAHPCNSVLELKRISILLTLISCTFIIWHLAHDAQYCLIFWIISSYSEV